MKRAQSPQCHSIPPLHPTTPSRHPAIPPTLTSPPISTLPTSPPTSPQVLKNSSEGRLDLSSQDIQDFSVAYLRPPYLDMSTLRYIHTLTLAHNKLTALDSEPLAALVELVHLNVSHNQLGRLNCDLPPTLETADFSNNKVGRWVGWSVQRTTNNNRQPTTDNQQPATHNPQPTTHNPQPTTSNPQPTTHNPQPRL